MRSGALVKTAVEDGVLRLRLNRPDRLNAVSEELYAALEGALEGLADGEARAVLLTGEGRAFCAGADLKEHAARERDAAERRAYVWAGQRVCRMLQTAPQPVVAAVQGYAIGAGAELAMSADLLICAEDAAFRLPEVGLGTFVGGGASQRLPLLVGQQRAKELLLLGRRISGVEAAEWGLAMRAVPAADLEAEAFGVARQLADQPSLSVRWAKQALNRAGAHTLDAALTFEAEALLTCMRTADWQAGIEAFENREDR